MDILALEVLQSYIRVKDTISKNTEAINKQKIIENCFLILTFLFKMTIETWFWYVKNSISNSKNNGTIPTFKETSSGQHDCIIELMLKLCI